MSKNNQTIEEKITELEAQVAWFDSDDFVLEEAVERYEAAKKLSKTITHELEELKNIITRIDDTAV